MATILLVKRNDYPEHRAILKGGALYLVPEFTRVSATDIQSVRRWTPDDTQKIIDRCGGVVCRM